MNLGGSRCLRICCLHSKKYADERDISQHCVFYAVDVDDHADKDLTHATVVHGSGF